MTRARFSVAAGETVTAFALGPLCETYYPGPRQPMEDRVDYRFVNGWVDVGDLPCRRATWEDVKTRPVPRLPEVTGDEVNLPGLNRRLDFSGFWHIPHRLSRAVRTRLIPPIGGDARFSLATCGGVNIWVDGTHVMAFEPFTRNAVQVREITLPLANDGSEVVMLVEEMAERDTTYFVELTWQGPGILVSEIPGDAAPELLDMLMALARDVRPAQLVLAPGEPLRLIFDNPPSADVTVKARVSAGVHLSHMPPIWETRATLQAGATEVCLGVPDLGDRYHSLELVFAVGDSRVARSVALALISESGPQTLPGTLDARKATALAHAAAHGEHRIGTVMAKLASGVVWDERSAQIWDDTLDGINRRRDCSDFVMIPLLWIMTQQSDAVPKSAATRAKAAILGYRYWMTEPGNDAMWFWSENHVLCFHAAQYLAGRLYPDEVFANSGKTGTEQEKEGRARLDRWFDAVEEDGLAEWNSAAYYPIDFIGLFALAQLGEAQIRTRARRMLDRLFTMIALHTIGGVSAGSMGRAYDKELRAGPLTELSPFAAVAWGQGWLNDGVAALPMFCLSDYAPAEELARDTAPAANSAVSARYIQGHGTQGRLALWKTAHMQLSACIDAAPGAGGHQQHLVDVQSGAAPFARAWVNHPGDDDPWGENRPSYWAGNGRMPRVGMETNTVLVLFDTGQNAPRPWTHAYAPIAAFDTYALGPDYLVLVSGHGAVTLKATGPITPVSTGPGAGIEWRCQGRQAGWVVRVDNVPPGGLDTLKDAARAMVLGLSGKDDPTLTLTGTGPRLALGWSSGLKVDGVSRPFPTQMRAPQIQRLTL